MRIPHLNCMPWCAIDHHPLNACEMTLHPAEAEFKVEGGTTFGLYGTEEGTFLNANGYAIAPSQAQTLPAVIEANLATLTASYENDVDIYDEEAEARQHMTWCMYGEHPEQPCSTVVYTDLHMTVTMQGAVGDQVGLQISPAFWGQPTPYYFSGTVQRPVAREVFLRVAELHILSTMLPGLQGFFPETRTAAVEGALADAR